MNTQIDTLRRFHQIFFPELPPPLEWYERLAALMQEHVVDDADIIAYFHAMSLHNKGLSCGNLAVTDGVRARLATLKHFGSRVTLVVPTTASERWLGQVIDFYNDIDLPVVFAVDARTSDQSRDLLSIKGAVCSDMDQDRQVDFLTPEIFDVVGTDWILRVDDDELPTPALLNFVDRAVEYSTEFVWGFPRVHCQYDASGELQYSQFLPFGPFAKADLKWRLIARPGARTQHRAAGSDALLLSFDWVVHSFVERVDKLKSRVAHDGQAVPSLAHFYLREAIPDSWHMFAPLSNERYRNFAEKIHQSRAGTLTDIQSSGDTDFSADPGQFDLRSATTDDLLAWRDHIIRKAAEQMGRSEVQAAVNTLGMLQHTTTDDKTLELTDPFFPQISGGRKVVASFDPRRKPATDEVVIIYGNYPHMFGNVVVNNPIKRHVADFWKFRHDLVEYDRRWDCVDQIFIINMKERRDRFDSILLELACVRAPLDRVTHVLATRMGGGDTTQVAGTIACLQSHIEALRRARAARLDHVLVLEDDFCFTSDIEQHLTDLQRFFERAYDYWICLIAASKYGSIIPKDDLLSISLQPCTNAAGYLVSREGLERLLPIFEDAFERLQATGDCVSNAADRCWAVLQPSGKFLLFRRKFGFQGSSFSDVERSISRYLD